MKPATPLPWKLGNVDREGDSIFADGKATFCDMKYYPWCERADFPYIVHAANNYGRLVELMKFCSTHAGIGNPLKADIQSFLRELGEL